MPPPPRYRRPLKWAVRILLEYIMLINIFRAEAEIDQRKSDINVFHKGWVFYAPHRVYNSACLIDVTNFPYDR